MRCLILAQRGLLWPTALLGELFCYEVARYFLTASGSQLSAGACSPTCWIYLAPLEAEDDASATASPIQSSAPRSSGAVWHFPRSVTLHCCFVSLRRRFFYQHTTKKE